MFFYNIFIRGYGLVIKLAAVGNDKADKWIKGRVEWELSIPSHLKKEQVAWFHCASLGEYDQAKPLIKKVAKKYKVVVSFFSPSGYEYVKKGNDIEYICYLPLDTAINAKKFVDAISPSIVFFVKYELWYNYLSELFSRDIPTYLVSANFRKDHFIFKWYGRFIKELLPKFTKIFVQYEDSLQVLKSENIFNVVRAGDTRFENVVSNCNSADDNQILERFKSESILIVAGSSWSDEERLLLEVGKIHSNVKIVYAPHDISESNIERLSNQLEGAIKYSDAKLVDLKESQYIIIDNMGMLKSLYKYADIVLVGGGFTNRLHNILEPAVFGKPVLFGDNHEKFPEGKALIEAGGALGQNKSDLLQSITSLVEDRAMRKLMGNKSQEFVENNLGATNKILLEIKKESNTLL